MRTASLICILILIPLLYSCKKGTKSSEQSHSGSAQSGSLKSAEIQLNPANLPDTLCPDFSHRLPVELDESSGLIYWDDLLWTHNDSEDNTLYGVNPENGDILREINLPGVTNRDWEDIAQDDLYIYIGDFGNNWGNRTDLHILKISKASVIEEETEGKGAFERGGDLEIGKIHFSYPEQEDLNARPYLHDFDCEAMIILNGRIILFTKEWITAGTAIYSLPSEPGRHVAKKIARWPVNGLITGADMDTASGTIALCGYNSVLQPFLHLAWDIAWDSLFVGKQSMGNHRKFHLPLFAHQVEAVTFSGSHSIYLSNEARNPGTSGAIDQQIHSIDLSSIVE